MPNSRSTPPSRHSPPPWADAVLLVDNYDSFSYNARDLLEQLGARVVVRRNDQLAVRDVKAHPPRAIVLSPGPGRPRSAGVCIALVRALGPACPILGICLGHQAIAEAFGGRTIRAAHPMHGQASEITSLSRGLFRDGPKRFLAARYHSLVVAPHAAGRDLRVTCRSKDGEIMGLVHRRYPVEGVQFHPESYMTPCGPELFERFLVRAGFDRVSVRRVVR